jgi:putative ABC transport system permease protein
MSFIQNFIHELKQEIPLSVAQLSHQKVRLLVALAGIGFANILIFMQLGFRSTLFNGTTRIHDQLEGEVFLMSDRAQFLGDKSFSKHHLYQADTVDGIASAKPLYYSQSSWVNPDTKEISSLNIIAFNPVQPVFKLQEVNQQLEILKLPDTVIYDRLSQPNLGEITKAFEAGNKVTTELAERKVTVEGLFTLGSQLFKNGHVITSDQNYLRFLGSSSYDNIQLGILTLEPEADLDTVVANLQANLPKEVKVMTREVFIQAESDYWGTMPAGIIFNFGAIMGFIVGVVIVYQVLYSDVNDHLAEYATLKAMGYSGGKLLIIIFQEATILAILGFLPGMGFSVAMYSLLAMLTRIPVGLRPDVALQVFLMTVVMCLISATIASRKLQSADPADVF